MKAMPCGEKIAHMDRKAKKPLMEKRRRARINKCLGDLKTLLLEHLKRDPSQTSKLEKADILEMTVHLLRRMQQDQLTRATMIQPSIKDRFLDGWRDCAAQVAHYAGTVDGMPPSMKEALQRHLAERYRILQQTLPSGPSIMPGPVFAPSTSIQNPRLPPITVSGFLNNGSGLIRTPVPGLYPPALNPQAFAAAAQWRAMPIQSISTLIDTQPIDSRIIDQRLPIDKKTVDNPIGDQPSAIDSRFMDEKSIIDNRSVIIPGFPNSLMNQSIVGSEPNARIDQEPPIGERSISTSTTPACFEDDDDSASCSSSEATNESDTAEATIGEKGVWRPWRN